VKYYFVLNNLQSRNGSLKQIRREIESFVIDIADELSATLNKDIRYYWTMRNTFGFIFTDFEWSRGQYERLIGKGEIDLFDRLKDDFDYVVLSRTTDRNFRIRNVNDKKVIIINLTHFKEFLNIIRDKTNTVKLFLYKFEDKSQEELIRSWLRNYEKFEEVKEEARITDVDSMLEVLNKYKIENSSDLDKLIVLGIETMKKISQIQIFESDLQEFKGYIDGETSEEVLHDFLFNHLWLIDFQYMLYRKKKKEILEVGQPDITVYKDAFGIERIAIIELKRADQEIITTAYRGEKKPVILAEVGKAISQTIHYLEELKSKNKILEGIVIVGKKKEIKDTFIENFNTYLHGVKVMTYDEIYDRAKNIIDILKQASEKDQ